MQKTANYHVPLEFWEMSVNGRGYLTGDFGGRGRKKRVDHIKKDFEILPGVTVGLYYKEKLKKADFNKYLF